MFLNLLAFHKAILIFGFRDSPQPIPMTDGNYWRVVLVAVPIVGAAVTTFFFLLRLYSRLLTKKQLDIGDLLMFFGLLFSYGVTISTIIGE